MVNREGSGEEGAGHNPLLFALRLYEDPSVPLPV